MTQKPLREKDQTSEEWMKKFDDTYGFVGQDILDYQKVFISDLINKERKSLNHDHEILVNTILDTKNQELKEEKTRLIQEIKEWVKENEVSYDTCGDGMEEAVPSKIILTHLNTLN